MASERLESWVGSANTAVTDFPLNNLPYGAFAGAGRAGVCVAIGDQVLDLTALEAAGALSTPSGAPLFAEPRLNALMAAGPAVWAAVRAELTEALAARSTRQGEIAPHLLPMDEVALRLPFDVAEYTDFYSSRQHAENVGTIVRGPENALPENWLHLPIGYNGRASSVVVSGTDVHRPLGQLRPPGEEAPIFGPCRRLDFELEMGAVVGQSSALGRPLTVGQADEMIFGYVLLNDWSARDVQTWEYRPLGPFQAKAFATTIGPWVVPAAALAPFRVAGPERTERLLPYLTEPGPMAYDIALEVELAPEGGEAATIARSNARHLYFSAAQQLAHHAVCGCPMQVGDLLGSGTISGPEPGGYGSLLELSWGGREPLALPGGASRTFLEDGDTVTLRGWAEAGDHRIGFGSCTGKILPAVAEPHWT
ncbi:MAG: fumarylacetoacetase [Pseudomonadota bacterium]